MFAFSHQRVASLGRRFALFLLSCNLFICSIPRCDFAQATVQDVSTLWQADDASTESMHHCHGNAKVEDQGPAKIGEPDLCQCELLRFLSTLPSDPVRTVSLAHQSPLTWDVTHILLQSISNFIPAVEPPYPEV